LTTRVGYLGPRGTFSEAAMRDALRAEAIEEVPLETIYDVLMAVREREVQWALAPIENSIEGPVTVTLDTLVTEAEGVAIAGELVRTVHHCLLAAVEVPLDGIGTILSHPQAAGQCSRFLRAELARAEVRAASSTAEAARLVAEHAGGDWAAIGTRLAAAEYGCVVLRERIEDHPENETRFVWLAAPGERPSSLPLREPWRADAAGKTSIVFWGPGAERAGWLLGCLEEFASRGINLTKIESRPRRERLGHYMFFADLEGWAEEPAVAEALAGLRSHCEGVLVLGSYPAARAE
jgi:prephenate dehydratase